MARQKENLRQFIHLGFSSLALSPLSNQIYPADNSYLFHNVRHTAKGVGTNLPMLEAALSISGRLHSDSNFGKGHRSFDSGLQERFPGRRLRRRISDHRFSAGWRQRHYTDVGLPFSLSDMAEHEFLSSSSVAVRMLACSAQ